MQLHVVFFVDSIEETRHSIIEREVEMTENRNREIEQVRGGVINNLTQHIKLIVRLVIDPRVNPLLKILPIGTLIYLIVPDIPGPFDDALVLWLGGYLFVELCPPDVVQEHLDEIRKVAVGRWVEKLGENDEVVDAEFKEEPDSRR